MAGHGASASPGHNAAQGSGTHIGATRKGGLPVVSGTVSTFRTPAVSSAQIGVIRQNVPIPAPIFGMRNARPRGSFIQTHLGGPRYKGEL